MKTRFLSFSLLHLTLVFACSTQEKTVDARQRYVGTYAMTGRQSLTVISPDTSYMESKIITSQLTVSKDEEASKIKITLKGYGYPVLLATLDGNTFELDVQAVPTKLPHGPGAVGLQEGNGFFVGNRITLTVLIEAVSEGHSLKNTITVRGKKE